MSLRVWLPLTKDLRNQGLLGDINFSATGTISDGNGKVGKCKVFSSSNLIAPFSYTLGDEGTLSVWVNLTANPPSDGGYFFEIASQKLYAKAVVGLGAYGGNDKKIAVMAGGKTDYTFAPGFVLNQWHHIVFVWSNTEDSYLYFDGALVKTYTNLKGGTIKSGNKFSIASSVEGTGLLSCKLNDIRIYDHCLSPMEVKQLAQGLVLHYPLNRNGWGQENLATITSTNQYQWTANSNFHYVWVNSGTLESNTTYTFSAEVIVNNDVDRCTIFNYSPGDYTGTRNDYFPADGKRHSWTFTTSETAIGLIIYAGPAGQDANNTAVYKNIKIEKGDKATPYIPRSNEALYTTMGLNGTIEYDCSGFCNNGTRTGTFSWTSDTPKYEVSTKFNGSEKISVNSLPSEVQSVSFWVKVPTIPSGYGICYVDSGTQTSIGFYNGNSFITSCTVSANVVLLGTTFKANEWNHIVLVKTGTNTRNVYCNGVLLTSSGTNSLVHNGGNLSLGWRDYASGNAGWFNGQLCDFRAYATALSADDVKSLYQNCATIDADGTIHGQIRS